MESPKLGRTVVLLSYLFTVVCALQIELFSEKDRHGQSIKIDVSDNDCSELPQAWHSSVASVDTLGSCVQFYDEPNCQGSLTVIQPFHIIHQMDLSLINYAYRLRTASPCGPKVNNGRYVIQNAADASVMAALNKHGNFARVWTVNTTKDVSVPKSQQWEVIERSDSEYFLKPRENSDNYPVSFDEDSLKKGSIRRKAWKIMSVGRGRYIIKDSATQRCLYRTDDFKVEEHSCRIWSTNQEWVFRTIVSDAPSEKSNAQVGNGFNFNILSKVATSRPPTKPPPQFYPIHFNASKLAAIKKWSTAAPYTVRKKIKRGPRPKSKYVDEPSLDLRPPGLRPALAKNVANNNNYLLFKPPNGPAKDSYLPEFVPSDDIDLVPTKEMIKNSQQYKQYVEIVKQYLTDQYIKTLPPSTLPTPTKKKKKKGEEDEDEEDESKEQNATNEEEAEDDDASDASEGKGSSSRRKKKPSKKNKDKYNDLAGPPDHPPPIPLSDEPGFMSKVFTKFKSNFAAVLPTVQLPSISNVLPTLPSVPKFSMPFTKTISSSNKEKVPNGSSSSGFQYSFSVNLGRNHDGSSSSEEHPQYSVLHKPGGRLFPKSSTTTKKPLTVGAWGIFG